jgi:hemolysin activation/secretion protein
MLNATSAKRALYVALSLSFADGSIRAEEVAAASPEQAAAAQESAPRFDVMEYQVENNTVLDSVRIEKTVYPFLGPGKGIDDVEKARAALENLYHEEGYASVLVDIPEQDVDGGVVILRVVESKVDRLKVSGSRYFSLGRIKEKVPALAEGQVLNVPKAQEQLAKLSEESGDRKITPVMRAGSTPGTVEVDLQVEDQLPLHGSLELNARNSIDTTRLRLIAQVRYDNLWQRLHSASLQYQVSPENDKDVEVWAGTYVMPLDFLDAKLALYGVGLDSSSNVAAAGALTVVGNGNIFGARMIKPLPPFEGYMHSLSLGWDYKDFGQSVVLQGADTQNTPISYLPFSLGYSGTALYGEGSYTQFNAEVNFSIRGLGNNQQEFEDKRFGAKPNYLYFGGDIKHQQNLPYDLRLVAKLAGQVADSPLISNEQFSAGGMLSVRGYHEVEVLGDDGVNGNLEFYSPNIGELAGWEWMDELRFMAFTDGAHLWVDDALPGTPSEYHIASAGLGLRTQIWRHLQGEFYWAYPFSPTDQVRVGENRLDFRVAYEF